MPVIDYAARSIALLFLNIADPASADHLPALTLVMAA
jgi:hypothetical protein